MENRTLVSLLFPAQSGELVKQLEGQGATVMAMDCIPRTLSRGQTYDALSSQVGREGEEGGGRGGVGLERGVLMSYTAEIFWP